MLSVLTDKRHDERTCLDGLLAFIIPQSSAIDRIHVALQLNGLDVGLNAFLCLVDVVRQFMTVVLLPPETVNEIFTCLKGIDDFGYCVCRS